MAGGGTYGTEVGVSSGARVASVEPGSPAERAGIVAGDVIVGVNGREPRDVIDWRWEADGASVDLDVRTGTARRSVTLARDPGEAWGFDFSDVLFDGIRTCRNACAFCFMAQLPRGLRPALYVRDDDYRLSFLQGNFVTLTNVDDADVDRIIEQHLSPLYVSLHAVTPDVRASLVCARDDRTLRVVDELLGAGIEIHVQIVLVPGVNDGEELELSLRWLAEREGVLSVGIVPLGYTGHQSRFTSSYEMPADASRVLEQLEPWRQAFFQRDGVSWVHAADEFYLKAGHPFPPAEGYDGFPQYENGIGLARVFADRFGERAEQAGVAGSRMIQADEPPVVVTGTLFAPFLDRLVQSHRLGDAFTILPVANDFFGGNVSVAGLLTGSDIARAIRGHGGGPRYLVPDAVLNADGLTLDGMTLAEIGEHAGTSVDVIASDADGLLSAIL